MYSSPKGILALSKVFNFEYRGKRRNINVASVLFLTFISYCVLHACRKALPVVKNKLQGTCGAPNETCTGGFAPFNEPSRSTYFTILDLAWAFSYAVGMLFMGHAAELFGRKVFLVICLFGTGVMVIFFGLGHYFDIHLIYYYILLQIFNGILQSAGWPTIISIVSSWVSKSTMGSVLGLWGNHYAVGNIMGQTLSAVFVDKNWGMAFIANGSLCIISSLLVLLFLASKPDSMGFRQEMKKLEEEERNKESQGDRDIDSPLSDQVMPISFGRILLLPGVLEYSFSLFFIKIVTYTFLFWLPYYIKSIDIKDYNITASTAGYMASMFDVGGIVGNIATGILLDLIKMGGTICFFLQILSCFTLYLFAAFGHKSMITCVSLLFATGFCVNAPHALITGSISASLGNSPALRGNKKATTSVSAIIDGIGSLGAALAPLVVYRISLLGWNYVMYGLIVSSAISGLLLLRLIFEEFSRRGSQLKK